MSRPPHPNQLTSLSTNNTLFCSAVNDAPPPRPSGFLSDNAMSPIVCQQVLTAFRVMRGDDGTNLGADKLRRLRENSNYFREGLVAIGCDVMGEVDSPVRAREEMRCV